MNDTTDGRVYEDPLDDPRVNGWAIIPELREEGGHDPDLIAHADRLLHMLQSMAGLSAEVVPPWEERPALRTPWRVFVSWRVLTGNAHPTERDMAAARLMASTGGVQIVQRGPHCVCPGDGTGRDEVVFLPGLRLIGDVFGYDVDPGLPPPKVDAPGQLLLPFAAELDAHPTEPTR